MARLNYVTVDVFTSTLFGGNPLAVVLAAEGLATDQMQAIAAEFGYSETAFVCKPATGDQVDAQLRIFTPQRELPFAGHPNIGTAFALAHPDTEWWGRGWEDAPAEYRFGQGAGTVRVALEWEMAAVDAEPQVVGAQLQAPERFREIARVADLVAAESVGLRVRDIRCRQHPPMVASAGLPFLLVEVHDRRTLHRAVPDPQVLSALEKETGAVGVYVYSRGRTDRGTMPLRARMFAPAAGVLEDPATGSAAAALAGLLAADHDGARWRWRIEQGGQIGRPSVLTAGVAGPAEGGVPVVGGRCVVAMRGDLHL